MLLRYFNTRTDEWRKGKLTNIRSCSTEFQVGLRAREERGSSAIDPSLLEHKHKSTIIWFGILIACSLCERKNRGACACVCESEKRGASKQAKKAQQAQSPNTTSERRERNWSAASKTTSTYLHRSNVVCGSISINPYSTRKKKRETRKKILGSAQRSFAKRRVSERSAALLR